MKRIPLSLLAMALVAVAPILHAEQIIIGGDTADTAIRGRNDSPTGKNIDTASTPPRTEPTMRVGSTSGGGSSEPISSVFVFQLPDISAADAANITNVSFASTLVSITNLGAVTNPTNGYGADLYAIGFRESSDVLLSDFWNGSTPPPADKGFTLIQQDYYHATAGDDAKDLRITTSTGADDLLTQFIVQQLINGGGGKYVFLALTPNFDDARVWASGGKGYNFATADNPNEAFRPELIITYQIPEASTLALFLAAGALLCAGVLRKRHHR